MPSHPPKVPPEQRSPHGDTGNPTVSADVPKEKVNDRDRNLAQQGRQGNIKQNTTNQGHQQDR